MTSVVLAGGGTAGHTSPLIATAASIQRRADADIVCIGTAKGLETTVIPDAGLSLELVDPVPLPRTINGDLLRLPVTLTRSVRQARRILRAADADVLVGFGGYVSIPAYLAAWTMRIPVVVHEANKLPGIANKVGARFAAFVGTTFPETVLRGSRVIGMPMRDSITEPRQSASEARVSLGLDPDRPTLLVSGGSQGALSINRAVDAARDDILAAGIQILHILGPKNFADDPEVVGGDGARYVPLAYVSDMAVAYTAADLMVGRAGAGTVMETAVSGLPVIFVPLPWGNGEQGRNAAELISAHAGWLLPDSEISADKLVELVVGAFRDADALSAMADTAKGMYPRDAADVLADAVLRAAQKGKPDAPRTD